MKRTFPIILTLIFFTMFTHAQSMQEVTVSNGQTTFSLFAPQKAKSVKVRIYNEGQAKKATKVIPLKYDAGRWVATVSQNLTGKYYTFQVNNMKECPGIFAKAVAVNGRRAYIADMASTNPEGWDTDRHPVVEKAVDHVLYELHFRDFSIDQSSKLQYKGKFLALTEPHAIEHLKTLGVNAVHILPSFDFGSIDETTLEKNQYNWGYDPMNYNVPEGSYSTDPYTP